MGRPQPFSAYYPTTRHPPTQTAWHRTVQLRRVCSLSIRKNIGIFEFLLNLLLKATFSSRTTKRLKRFNVFSECLINNEFFDHVPTNVTHFFEQTDEKYGAVYIQTMLRNIDSTS